MAAHVFEWADITSRGSALVYMSQFGVLCGATDITARERCAYSAVVPELAACVLCSRNTA